MDAPAPTGKSSPFGVLLRRYREAAGLSQGELAQRAGMSGQAIGRLERGERLHPYPATLRRLAAALRLTGQERASLLAAVPPRDPVSGAVLAGALPALPTPSHDETQDAARFPDLPVPLTSLLGRERDVDQVTDLLVGGTRLLTLTGPGGVGKSRLALRVAQEIRERFADGAVFVPLAPLTDPQLVLPTVARVLGVRENAELPVGESIHRALHGRHLLVVMDNCEHVLPAASAIVALLEACPNLVILATSRAPLRVRGEQEWVVAPLTLPAFDQATNAAGSATSPAVQLFVERARAARVDFKLTETNAGAVASICRQLDGLPLALELAAPRLKLLSPAALLERLHAALPLLAGGLDVPARQQTLRATFAWSYDLLDEGERALLRRLSVFAGGCTFEAGQAVGGMTMVGETDVLEGLASLVDQSLLRLEEVAGQSRFRMLETIREYARDELRRHGEEAEARKAHAAFIVGLVEEIDPRLSGPGQVQCIARLMAEQDDVRAALRWLLDGAQLETAGHLLIHLVRFWWVSGQMVEARRWANEVLARGTAVPVRARAQAFFVAGTAAAENGDEAAADLLAEVRIGARAAGDRLLEGMGLFMEGFVAPVRGDAARGVALMRQALEILRETGDLWSVGFCLSGLSALSALLGRLEDAERFGAEYLAIAERMGDPLGLARAKDCLALVALLRDELDRAAGLLRESIGIGRDVDQPQLIARGLMGQAVVVGKADPGRAARYFGAADALRQAAGVAIWHVRQPLYDRALNLVRTTLGPEAFDAAWREGTAMTRDEAIAYVLDDEPVAGHGA